MTLYDKRKQKPFWLVSEGRRYSAPALTGWQLIRFMGWIAFWGVVIWVLVVMALA